MIFPDTKCLADFVSYIEMPGEVDGQEYSFVGNLTEDHIKTAQLIFGAYVRVMRELK